MTHSRGRTRRHGARRSARARSSAESASGASTTAYYAAEDRRSRPGGAGAIWIWLLFVGCWIGAAMLDPAFDDKRLFHPRSSVGLNAFGRVIATSMADSIQPYAPALARILFVLPFVVMIAAYLYERASRPERKVVTVVDAGAEGEGDAPTPRPESEDERFAAIHHRRQVAATALTIGVVATGVILRLATGRTDHGSVVFIAALAAIFLSHRLVARCPRCGVTLTAAARQREGRSWLSPVGVAYWRLLACPACRVRLRQDQ